MIAGGQVHDSGSGERCEADDAQRELPAELTRRLSEEHQYPTVRRRGVLLRVGLQDVDGVADVLEVDAPAIAEREPLHAASEPVGRLGDDHLAPVRTTAQSRGDVERGPRKLPSASPTASPESMPIPTRSGISW